MRPHTARFLLQLHYLPVTPASEVELHPFVALHEAEAFVEAVGIVAGFVAGQLDALASEAAGFGNHPLHHGFADALAAHGFGDVDALDFGGWAAPVRKTRQQVELERPDDRAIDFGDHHLRFREADETAERGEISVGQRWAEIFCAEAADGAKVDEFDDAREVGFGGWADRGVHATGPEEITNGRCGMPQV